MPVTPTSCANRSTAASASSGGRGAPIKGRSHPENSGVSDCLSNLPPWFWPGDGFALGLVMVSRRDTGHLSIAPPGALLVLPDDVDDDDLGRSGRFRRSGGGGRLGGGGRQQRKGAGTDVLTVEGGGDGQDVLCAEQLRLLAP